MGSAAASGLHGAARRDARAKRQRYKGIEFGRETSNGWMDSKGG